MNVELRELRYFVAVAEELHFTRAAARLHIAQQPLSAAIARLEDRIGVPLFARTTRRVELTPAGTALLEPARAALRAADDAVATAVAAGRGVAGELAVGLSNGAWYGLEPLFDRLRERHAGLRLQVRQQSTQPLLEEVRADRLQLAVGLCVHAPGDDLAMQRLKDEPALLAVPAGHRLARRRRVSVAELADEEFALDDPGEGPGYNAAVLAVCGGGGFAPRARELASHHDAWQNAVLHDGCIGLTVRSAIHSGHQGLRLVALDPPSTFPLDLVWRRGAGERSPALAAVLATAADVAREERWVAAAS